MKQYSISIILALYVVLAATYSVITPLGEGPDEPGHAAYVFFLAREWRLPNQRINEVPGEGHQPPLAYALAVPALVWLPQAERTFDLPGNSRFVWAGGDQANAAAHGSREFWPWQAGVLAWHLARLVSVACGAVTVGMTFLIAHNLRFAVDDLRKQSDAQEERDFAIDTSIENRTSKIGSFPLLAAALVAFNPQFLFVNGLISNDALLAMFGSVALWLCVRGRGSRVGNYGSRTTHGAQRNAVAVGVVLGLALLTKQSALVLVPMIALATVRWSEWRRGISVRNHLVSLSPCLLVFAIAGLISGWWYLRNWQLYGDPLGLSVFQAEFTTQPFDFTHIVAWRDALVQLHTSFWARFGWMNVVPPAWVFVPFVAVELWAVVGWIGGWRRGEREKGRSGNDQAENREQRTENREQRTENRESRTENREPRTENRESRTENREPRIENRESRTENREPRIENRESRIESLHYPSRIAYHASRWTPLLVLIATTFVWVLLFARTAGLVAWQGRLLFPAISAIAIVLAAGVQRSGVRVRSVAIWWRGLVIALIGGIFASAIYMPFGIIQPAYPRQVLPEQTARARLGTPVYGRFGLPGDPGAELRGYRLQGELQPGAALELHLIWHAAGRQNRDWTVFVHVVDSQGRIVAQSNGEPRSGAFPMGQWVANDWIEDVHSLQLPDTFALGSYSLRVGLFDAKGTQERAGVWNEKGRLVGDYLELGTPEASDKKQGIAAPKIYFH